LDVRTIWRSKRWAQSSVLWCAVVHPPLRDGSLFLSWLTTNIYVHVIARQFLKINQRCPTANDLIWQSHRCLAWMSRWNHWEWRRP
jgi:hypothetical protein